MEKGQVFGIGETVYDIIFKDDAPQRAVPGGSTFNALVSLGRVGVPCNMVSEVGDDHVAELIYKYLIDNGVGAQYVYRHAGAKSHISLAFLDEKNDAHYTFYKDYARVRVECRKLDICNRDFVLFGSFFAINPAIRGHSTISATYTERKMWRRSTRNTCSHSVRTSFAPTAARRFICARPLFAPVFRLPP